MKISGYFARPVNGYRIRCFAVGPKIQDCNLRPTGSSKCTIWPQAWTPICSASTICLTCAFAIFESPSRALLCCGNFQFGLCLPAIESTTMVFNEVPPLYWEQGLTETAFDLLNRREQLPQSPPARHPPWLWQSEATPLPIYRPCRCKPVDPALSLRVLGITFQMHHPLQVQWLSSFLPPETQDQEKYPVLGECPAPGCCLVQRGSWRRHLHQAHH